MEIERYRELTIVESLNTKLFHQEILLLFRQEGYFRDISHIFVCAQEVRCTEQELWRRGRINGTHDGSHRTADGGIEFVDRRLGFFSEVNLVKFH